MRTLVILALAGASCGGCTFEDGRGFARLSGSLWARFASLDDGAGRITADGWYRTDRSFELQLQAVALEIDALRLQRVATAAAGAGSCTLDPADPPAGCTLCHGGHCHCDGQLKSYEQLEAELCGGGGGTTLAEVASVTLPSSWPLLAEGTRHAFADEGQCSPSCELGAGQIDRISLSLARLHVNGRVRDGSALDRLHGAEPALAVAWPLDGAALTAVLDEPALLDRDHPYHLRLALTLAVPAGLFDSIEWDQLARQQAGITIDRGRNSDAGEIISTNLALSELSLQLTRSDDQPTPND